jgi:hypothetical protein
MRCVVRDAAPVMPGSWQGIGCGWVVGRQAQCSSSSTPCSPHTVWQAVSRVVDGGHVLKPAGGVSSSKKQQQQEQRLLILGRT